ncbi:MAG: hypothetical protein ABEI78_01060, partial [Candidatus Nanohaloarchaea archaeon]
KRLHGGEFLAMTKNLEFAHYFFYIWIALVIVSGFAVSLSLKVLEQRLLFVILMVFFIVLGGILFPKFERLARGEE